jgi:hypothetical protein
MSPPYATLSFPVWMAVATSCVELPPIPARSVTDEPADQEPEQSDGGPGEPLRLGAWNLRKYGFETQKDEAAIAAIVKAHFDLIALLEVVATPGERALSDLARLLGPEFALAGTSAARPSPSSVHSEHYVVAYRPARIAPCAELGSLTFFADGAGSDGSASRGLFLREPAFACFRAVEARGPAREQSIDAARAAAREQSIDPARGAAREQDIGRARGFDFLLAAYHAEWGEGDARGIAAEVQHIDGVFAAMQRALPGEQALYMIGDFNLGSAELAPLTAARDRTAGSGSTLDARGEISGNLYDHLLALGAGANAALVGDARVLDVRGEAFDPGTFRDRVSDHLPILAQLRLSEDDD